MSLSSLVSIEGPNNVVALIDADSMIYASGISKKSFNAGKKMLESMIDGAIHSIEPWSVSVFCRGEHDENFRKDLIDNYKGNRSLDPEDRARVEKLYQYCWNAGWEPAPLGEAEDYVGIWNRKMSDSGRLVPVMAHIDKDLDQIPGQHYDFKKKTMYTVPYRWGFAFLAIQTLAGDRTDNIFGIKKGVGLVKASKMLGGCPMRGLWGKIVELYQEQSDSPQGWERHLWEVFNSVYIRQYERDLQPLTWERIQEIMVWHGPKNVVYSHERDGVCIAPDQNQNILEMYPSLLEEGGRVFKIANWSGMEQPEPEAWDE
jgi:hypothetical protein